jgi:hypothetical protein
MADSTLSPYPQQAQVISQDPQNDAVYVQLQSGQVLNFPVRRMYSHADGLRMSKGPLPSRGSHIFITFPGGDIRNPMMLGAFHPNQNDPIPNGPNDPFSTYESHFNGSWSHMEGLSGFVTHQFSDNSSFVIGSGNLAVPTIMRHLVNSGQVQERIPFPQNERNPSPQPPFGMKYTQATSGASGGTNMTIDVSGNMVVSGTTLRTMTIHFGGSTVFLNADGTVNITPGNSQNVVINGNLLVSQEIVWKTGTSATSASTHVHGGITTGGSNTQQPVPGS